MEWWVCTALRRRRKRRQTKVEPEEEAGPRWGWW